MGLAGAAVLAGGALAVTAACAVPSANLGKLFEGREPPVVVSTRTAFGDVSALAVGREDGPLVLFVHGTPGDAEGWGHLLASERLSRRARLMAVDRPGWGASGGKLRPALADQAAALADVAEAFPSNRPVIVVGHSLGGPIVARLAVDRPELVGGVVLVSPALDPALEETTWYQAVARWRVVRWAVPEALRRADDELKPLKGELEALEGLWSRWRVPVVVVQGEKDSLVPAENADFAERVLPAGPATRVVRLKRQGHLIPWEDPGAIVVAVEGLLPPEDP